MAYRAVRIALRRIHVALYGIKSINRFGGDENLRQCVYDDQAKQLSIIGPCIVDNICTRYVPQSKNIRLRFSILEEKFNFIPPGESGAPCVRRDFGAKNSPEGSQQVAIFTNGKITFMGFKSRNAILNVFEKVKEIAKQACAEGKSAPFSEALATVDSAADRETKADVWSKKRKSSYDNLPCEQARKRQKLSHRSKPTDIKMLKTSKPVFTSSLAVLKKAPIKLIQTLGLSMVKKEQKVTKTKQEPGIKVKPEPGIKVKQEQSEIKEQEMFKVKQEKPMFMQEQSNIKQEAQAMLEFNFKDGLMDVKPLAEDFSEFIPASAHEYVYDLPDLM